ncbi:aldehyde dehydrogenase family protein [Goodfellowiella coeruleoviolacea]|uniref:Acyl-CoA reductase n=1 Tax=Goodfellowiella coeruleoviolacea TaxID=334858 RepID=A0AAE3GMN6_9PSEU|nr:aldehyde dehydrogenase family protein [Goodfellowiella coeruleoviolacea]MCP2170277.1 Acyl-CoA reductase [Goodfellowiella coeruleoviolacea]
MAAAVDAGLVIAGRAEPVSPDAAIPVWNPARPDELVGRAAAGSAVDAARAVDAAHGALAEWSTMDYAERGAVLRRCARDLDTSRYAEILVRENGKVRREAEVELARFTGRLIGVADMADLLAAEETHPGPPLHSRVTYRPRGVAVLIIPWNWPLSVLGACLPHALIAGATVVVKPPPTAPLATTLTLATIAAALPPGVVNVVTGRTEEIGPVLLTHPRVGHIAFTGSVESGRRIYATAAAHLKPVTLELGGNDAALVLADAELDEAAVRRLATGAFLGAGQVCVGVKRLYVHRSRYDEVVDALTRVVSATVVGDGLDPRSTMGPVHTEAARRRLRAQISSAGGAVRELGEVLDPEQFDRGWFVRPALALDPDPGADLVRTEQFGPALPIIPFRTDDEAVDLANASNFGLASSVWSATPGRAEALARRLDAGITFVNAHGATVLDERAPFGGTKDSGIGCELGWAGVREFQVAHTLTRFDPSR